ncbi:hypothetical protein [Halegenticoccus tardaugens]|uniref:hypothetical protein n=1 Tax=Halegenticoccus tardaugens TaxID=2071624 RepID=UPI00100BBB3B|nr:hypothetical protein [Halegenticoccus tardaugens]
MGPSAPSRVSSFRVCTFRLTAFRISAFHGTAVRVIASAPPVPGGAPNGRAVAAAARATPSDRAAAAAT